MPAVMLRHPNGSEALVSLPSITQLVYHVRGFVRLGLAAAVPFDYIRPGDDPTFDVSKHARLSAILQFFVSLPIYSNIYISDCARVTLDTTACSHVAIGDPCPDEIEAEALLRCAYRYNVQCMKVQCIPAWPVLSACSPDAVDGNAKCGARLKLAAVVSFSSIRQQLHTSSCWNQI